MDLKKLNKEERQKWAAGLMDRMANAALIGDKCDGVVSLYAEGASAYADLFAGVLDSINALEAPLVVVGLGLLGQIVIKAFPESEKICEEYFDEILNNVQAKATADDGEEYTIHDGCGSHADAGECIAHLDSLPLFDADERREFWRLVAEGATRDTPSGELATEALKSMGYREEGGVWARN